MYYPDLTVYWYSKFPEKLKKRYQIGDEVVFYNVGWLDFHYDYPTGFVGDEFLTAFQECVKNADNMFRGFHVCQFCKYKSLRNGIILDPDHDRTSVNVAGEDRWLGCMEIFVFGDNCVYICPDMIIHYMKDHDYRPPAAFCEAVLPGITLPGVTSEPLLLSVGQDGIPTYPKRKPCFHCSEKEAIIKSVRPQLVEMQSLLRTVGGLVGESELQNLVPNYTDLLAKLERMSRENVNLIDQCPEICSRAEIAKLFDEIAASFAKSYRRFPSGEVAKSTVDRIIFTVPNNVIRKTWG